MGLNFISLCSSIDLQLPWVNRLVRFALLYPKLVNYLSSQLKNPFNHKCWNNLNYAWSRLYQFHREQHRPTGWRNPYLEICKLNTPRTTFPCSFLTKTQKYFTEPQLPFESWIPQRFYTTNPINVYANYRSKSWPGYSQKFRGFSIVPLRRN